MTIAHHLPAARLPSTRGTRARSHLGPAPGAFSSHEPMPRTCYSAGECAEKLGIPHDLFLQDYESLVATRKMPPRRPFGRLQIPRTAFDAWLLARQAAVAIKRPRRVIEVR